MPRHQLTSQQTRRLRNRLFALLAVLLACAAAWWIWGPRTYRQIGVYTMGGQYLQSGAAGFVIEAPENQYVFRDWKGKVRWSVEMPRILPAPVTETDDRGERASLSPDGHVFAACTVIPEGVRLRIWRDGQLVGEHTLQEDIQPQNIYHTQRGESLRLRALDDGPIYLYWSITWNKCPIYLFQSRDLIARGEYSFPGIVSQDGLSYSDMEGYALITRNKTVLTETARSLLIDIYKPGVYSHDTSGSFVIAMRSPVGRYALS